MQIYKTTNLINRKNYIGQDSYSNPKYLGSGRKLKEEVDKRVKERNKKVSESCKAKNVLRK